MVGEAAAAPALATASVVLTDVISLDGCGFGASNSLSLKELCAVSRRQFG